MRRERPATRCSHGRPCSSRSSMVVHIGRKMYTAASSSMKRWSSGGRGASGAAAAGSSAAPMAVHERGEDPRDRTLEDARRPVAPLLPQSPPGGRVSRDGERVSNDGGDGLEVRRMQPCQRVCILSHEGPGRTQGLRASARPRPTCPAAEARSGFLRRDRVSRTHASSGVARGLTRGVARTRGVGHGVAAPLAERAHEVEQQVGEDLVRGGHRDGARLGGAVAGEAGEDARLGRESTHGAAERGVRLGAECVDASAERGEQVAAA
eukprot:scaffold61712_cov69-Phaeocystis_antarctica.AAC.3